MRSGYDPYREMLHNFNGALGRGEIMSGIINTEAVAQRLGRWHPGDLAFIDALVLCLACNEGVTPGHWAAGKERGEAVLEYATTSDAACGPMALAPRVGQKRAICGVAPARRVHRPSSRRLLLASGPFLANQPLITREAEH